MKRTFSLTLATLLAVLLVPSTLKAQSYYQKALEEGFKPFYTTEEAPHLENVLPAPPSMSDPRFLDDWNQYLWGKSIRETERGQQAIEDASVGAKYFLKRFSAAMDIELTPENSPVLYLLLYRTHMTEMQAGASAKKHFKRVRPYQQFKEPTAVPSHENPTDFTSYPSGHTHISWAAGMIMTALDPAHTEEIMKVAYELGQSRVIVGYHYQSDVDAGRVAGSITFARLCAIPEFLGLLQEAQKEFEANSKR